MLELTETRLNVGVDWNKTECWSLLKQDWMLELTETRLNVGGDWNKTECWSWLELHSMTETSLNVGVDWNNTVKQKQDWMLELTETRLNVGVDWNNTVKQKQDWMLELTERRLNVGVDWNKTECWSWLKQDWMLELTGMMRCEKMLKDWKYSGLFLKSHYMLQKSCYCLKKIKQGAALYDVVDKPTSTRVILDEEFVERYPSTAYSNHHCAPQYSHQAELLRLTKLSTTSTYFPSTKQLIRDNSTCKATSLPFQTHAQA